MDSFMQVLSKRLASELARISEHPDVYRFRVDDKHFFLVTPRDVIKFSITYSDKDTTGSKVTMVIATVRNINFHWVPGEDNNFERILQLIEHADISTSEYMRRAGIIRSHILDNAFKHFAHVDSHDSPEDVLVDYLAERTIEGGAEWYRYTKSYAKISCFFDDERLEFDVAGPERVARSTIENIRTVALNYRNIMFTWNHSSSDRWMRLANLIGESKIDHTRMDQITQRLQQMYADKLSTITLPMST